MGTCYTRDIYIHKACQEGNVKRVEQLIKAGVNVNYCDDNVSPPIYHAIAYEQDKCVELLIGGKANINTTLSTFDFSPLQTACDHQDTRIAKMLIKSKADVNYANRYGEAPIPGVLAKRF